MKVLDLTGQAFGRLLVEGLSDKRPKRWWRCLCQCGRQVTVRTDNLRDGKTRSCGCLCIEMRWAQLTTHGLFHHRAEYIVWKNMVQRCTNSKNPNWVNYGGRGITVCERWLKFENFFADMGSKPPRLTLERQRNNEGYTKDNCSWATSKVQARNRRSSHLVTLRGKTQCLDDWAREFGLADTTVHSRLAAGWSIEQALTTPARPLRRRK